MQKEPKRRRPRISATIGGYTAAVIAQVAKDKGLPNPGVTVDYIVKEWVDMKKADAPRITEPAC
jgi:hypothetical protein